MTQQSSRFFISSGVTTGVRSDLLSSVITFLSCISEMISLSFSSSVRVLSTTKITRSASVASFLAFSTPILSTKSTVSRIPAVSIRFNWIPPIVICSSSVSLVVPSMYVTIARSSFARALRRLDFPALVLPRITVRIPSFAILPLSHVFNKLSTLSPHFRIV